MISLGEDRGVLGCGFGLVLAFFGAGMAFAQSNGNFPLGGNATSPSQTCVQTQIGNEKPSPYGCLNQQLQQQATGANSGQPSVPLNANSQSNAVGTFNEQGVRQQYGQNFGKSAIPYRPPPPVYGGSLKP